LNPVHQQFHDRGVDLHLASGAAPLLPGAAKQQLWFKFTITPAAEDPRPDRAWVAADGGAPVAVVAVARAVVQKPPRCLAVIRRYRKGC